VLGGLLAELKDSIHTWDIAGRKLSKPVLFLIDETGQLELGWLPGEVSTIAALGAFYVTCWQSLSQIQHRYASLADTVLGGSPIEGVLRWDRRRRDPALPAHRHRQRARRSPIPGRPTCGRAVDVVAGRSRSPNNAKNLYRTTLYGRWSLVRRCCCTAHSPRFTCAPSGGGRNGDCVTCSRVPDLMSSRVR
jgi:hypothetical protein